MNFAHVTGSWSNGSTLPVPRSASCALALADGELFAVGLVLSLALALATAGVCLFFWGYKCGREGRLVSPLAPRSPDVDVTATNGSPAAVTLSATEPDETDGYEDGYTSPPPRI